MKKFVLLFLFLLTLTSCSKFDVLIDNPTIIVSKSIVRNGDEIEISMDSGESNIVWNANYFFDNKGIGSSCNPPYRICHIVSNMPPGLYSISCKCTYSEQKGTITSNGSFETFVFIEVVD